MTGISERLRESAERITLADYDFGRQRHLAKERMREAADLIDKMEAQKESLVEALKHARNQIQHPDELIDVALAAVGEGEA